jgi:hypothetical protein
MNIVDGGKLLYKRHSNIFIYNDEYVFNKDLFFNFRYVIFVIIFPKPLNTVNCIIQISLLPNLNMF